MIKLSVVEALDEEHTPEVMRSLHEVAAHTGHAPLADPKLATLHGRGRGFIVIAHAAQADHSDGVAVAVPTTADGEVWNIGDAAVLDETRRALVRRAIDEASARNARRIQWWAFQVDADDDALAAALRLRPWRDVVQLRRPLPLPDTALAELLHGVRLRSFAPGQDNAALITVNARAFADHPEQNAFDAEALAGRMAESWFDPADLLLAEDDQGVVGFCWVKIPSSTPTHGEIYVIGVDPRAQGSGLGRTLVLAGLARMTHRGAPEARLYTDATNVRALRLYDGLGFTRHHVDRAYAIDLPT